MRHLLIEEVGGIRVVEPDPEPTAGEDPDEALRSDALGDEASEDRSILGEAEEALRQARRQAAAVVVFDLVAVVILLLMGGSEASPLSQLTLGRSEQTIFTLAILLITVHAGFRLGQLEKYNAVARASAELAERDPEGA